LFLVLLDLHNRRAIVDLVPKPLCERCRKQVGAAFDLLPALRVSTEVVAKMPFHRIGKTVDRNFFTTATIKPQRMQPARIKRLERKSKLLHILVREIMIVRNTRRARFSIKTIGERLMQGVYTPARTRSRFENSHVVPELRQFISSNKPGHSGAQNEHLFGRAT